MLTHRETQTETLEEIVVEAQRKFLAKPPKLGKNTKGAARN
jgi:hypothetical protein